MELFAKRMTWELDNEEGLSCLLKRTIQKETVGQR